MLGDVYTNDTTKTADEAIAAYKKAIELNPKYPDALYRAGHGLWKKVQDYLNAHPDATNEQVCSSGNSIV
ncbi:MAG: tetratricopeptide repeat protein [Porphyromonadaceae bacterium]|nr:MAG: tetratricopeptide repeat protein [Porphyromonadaceae bacterium]